MNCGSEGFSSSGTEIEISVDMIPWVQGKHLEQ